MDIFKIAQLISVIEIAGFIKILIIVYYFGRKYGPTILKLPHRVTIGDMLSLTL